MVGAIIIEKYFHNLSVLQQKQIGNLENLYKEWNEQINVISRKDIDSIYVHHVLHSLALAKALDITKYNKISDIGTGGGFPGIPLAILYPESKFTLVDSIGKKIKVVKGVADALGLTNVSAIHTRAENINTKFDLIVCRAVTRLAEFYNWVIPLKHKNSVIACLKGGDLNEEITEFKKQFGKEVTLIRIPQYFEEEFFETKQILIIN